MIRNILCFLGLHKFRTYFTTEHSDDPNALVVEKNCSNCYLAKIYIFGEPIE